jgi:hypothetical protein
VKGAPITDIERSVKVGVGLMAATYTNKDSLALAIGGVAVSAFVARLGCVASVNRFDLDAVLAPDMFDLGKQRREWPSVMNQSLLFRNSDSRPNTLKVFDDYRSCVGFQGFSGNLIGDIPE